jgi:TRAP-type transport system small permease protein
MSAMMNIWRIFKKIADILVKACAAIGGISIALIVLIAVGDIAGTKFFNRAIPSAIELQEALAATLIFSGFVLAIHLKAHLVVDIVTDKLSGALSFACSIFAMTVTFIVFGVVALQNYQLAMRSLLARELSPGFISFPLYLVKLMVLVLCICAVVECLRQLIQLLLSGSKSGLQRKESEGLTL